MMKTFSVHLEKIVTHVAEVEVKASTAQEAGQIALEIPREEIAWNSWSNNVTVSFIVDENEEEEER